MEIYYFQHITLGFWLNSRTFSLKSKIFFAKLKNFSPKLKVLEIPVSVGAGKSVKKLAWFMVKGQNVELFWP